MSLFAPVRKSDSLSPLVVPVLVLPQQTLFPMMKLPVRIRPGALPELRRCFDAIEGNLLVVNQEQLRLWSAKSAGVIGCLAEVQLHRSGNDDHHLLILKGRSRVRFELLRDSSSALSEEIPMARVQRIPDVPLVLITELASLRRQLIGLLRRHCPELALPEMNNVLECELPFGQLVDLAAISLGLRTDDLMEILNELNVETRCRQLLARVEFRIQQRRSMVTRFGMN